MNKYDRNYRMLILMKDILLIFLIISIIVYCLDSKCLTTENLNTAEENDHLSLSSSLSLSLENNEICRNYKICLCPKYFFMAGTGVGKHLFELNGFKEASFISVIVTSLLSFLFLVISILVVAINYIHIKFNMNVVFFTTSVFLVTFSLHFFVLILKVLISQYFSRLRRKSFFRALFYILAIMQIITFIITVHFTSFINLLSEFNAEGNVETSEFAFKPVLISLIYFFVELYILNLYRNNRFILANDLYSLLSSFLCKSLLNMTKVDILYFCFLILGGKRFTVFILLPVLTVFLISFYSYIHEINRRYFYYSVLNSQDNIMLNTMNNLVNNNTGGNNTNDTNETTEDNNNNDDNNSNDNNSNDNNSNDNNSNDNNSNDNNKDKKNNNDDGNNGDNSCVSADNNEEKNVDDDSHNSDNEEIEYCEGLKLIVKKYVHSLLHLFPGKFQNIHNIKQYKTV